MAYIQAGMHLSFALIVWFSTCLVVTEQVDYRRDNVTLRTQPKRSRAISYEKILFRYLLMSYKRIGTNGRPVLNASDTVKVKFGLGLVQMDVVEKHNILSISAWTRYSWRDEYLQWDPDEYGGVTNVKMPHVHIWTPDIMLLNTANTEQFERSALAVVSSDGHVNWYPHRLFQSSCSIDVRNFPFDNQTCHMMFNSWTHPIEELDLDMALPGGIDLSTFQSDYKASSKWDITGTEAIRHARPHQFAVLRFTLHLKRRLMFSSYILTMPAVFLSLLTLVVFWLPADEPDKSVLGLTIFSSILLLLLILVEAAPPTASAVPLLGIYYCFTTGIVMLSIFLSTLVVKIGNVKGKRRRVPKWIKCIFFQGLGRLLCMETYDHSCERSMIRMWSRDESCLDVNGKSSRMYVSPDQVSPLKLKPIDLSSTKEHTDYSCVVEQLRNISGVLTAMQSRQVQTHETRDLNQSLEREWRHLASILDRLFSMVYIIAITIALAFLFPRP